MSQKDIKLMNAHAQFVNSNDQFFIFLRRVRLYKIIFLDNIRNYTRTVYERKLQNVSDKFPNAKIVFMVKDPRAFIATRLRRARSQGSTDRQYRSVRIGPRVS